MDDTLITALVREQLPRLIGTVFGWAMLGSLLGGLGCAGAFWLLRRLGAYLLPARSIWVAVLLTATILVGLIGGGIAGFHQGVLSGVRHACADSRIADAALPHLGRAGALLLAGVSTLSAPDADPHLLRARLDAFEEGMWSLDVTTLPAGAAHISPSALALAVNEVKTVLGASQQQLDSPSERGVVSEILAALAAQLLPHSQGPVSNHAIIRFAGRVIAGLPAEAARAGDGHTLSCRALSAFIGRESLEPFIFVPLRASVRGHQWLCLLALAAWLGLSVGGSRLVKRNAAV